MSARDTVLLTVMIVVVAFAVGAYAVTGSILMAAAAGGLAAWLNWPNEGPR